MHRGWALIQLIQLINAVNCSAGETNRVRGKEREEMEWLNDRDLGVCWYNSQITRRVHCHAITRRVRVHTQTACA